MKLLNNTEPDMLQECEALSHEKIQRSELTRTQECDRISVPSSMENGNLREVSNCASLFSDRLTISKFTILRKLADKKSKAHTHMV